ncbi:leucine-rich repeat domain-containing protein [Pseudoflavonifractor phocaeensis]|nr:leucine-rich repeat domain-containing protein [Pseudoflavonifractor phocaeensis]
MNVGAMYITDDGKTRLHIRVWDTARSHVPLYFSQTVANGVTIDWGDGSATETLAGTGNVNTTHQYTEAGDYTITLNPAEGCTLGLGAASSSYCVMGSTGNNGIVYCNLLQDVKIGSNVTSIDIHAFRYCYSLASITIPDGVTSIKGYAFQYCYSLASITIPDGVTSIGISAFSSCSSLASITIPDSVTGIGNSAFSSCSSLASITIPDGVAIINNETFNKCPSLSSLTIPDSVASIGSYVFQYCYGIAKYHLKPTKPPTLYNTNAFTSIPSDCVIYVPVGFLEAYQTATNWTTYASYMQEEPA